MLKMSIEALLFSWADLSLLSLSLERARLNCYCFYTLN